MKYRVPPLSMPFIAATLACVSLIGCGGGSGGDKPATASAQVSPVSDSASAAIASADAASAAASAASAASEPAAQQATAKALAAVKTAEQTSTTTATATATPTATTTAVVAPVLSTSGTTTAKVTTALSSSSSMATSPVTGTPTPSTGTDTTASVGSSTGGKTSAAATQTADLNILGNSYSLNALNVASADLVNTVTVNKTSTTCKVGYTPPASLTLTTAATRPANGGVFFSNAELTTWRSRIAAGPFVTAADYMKGSPGDWDRITANSSDFLKNGDKGPTSTTPGEDFGRLGSTARDAAFVFLLTADGKAFTAVKNYLVAQTANSAANFTTLCLTDNANWNPDAYYFQASWFLRYMATYDFVRTAMSTADRVTVENYIRRNAYFFATQMDYAMQNIFPARLKGDYTKKSWVAAPTNETEMWWFKRYDTNGDCTIDTKDKATADPVYAYVTADGKVGPRISVVSQYYNNRRAVQSLAIGAAGLTLADSTLISNAKRYVFEWLTYGVWPDGSQGEFARNGDYCIPQQGVIYSAANTAGAALLATLLTRQGDTSIQSFKTTDGLFGTQSTGSAPAKTLDLAVRTQLGLINGSLKWFYHQPWRTTQDLSDANSMNGMRSYYMKSIKPLENYHELGLLPAAKLLPEAGITGIVMRDKTATSLAFPGVTGNPVTTGWGQWNDPFNALPAVLLTRP